MPPLAACVIVPAKDEAASIPYLLASLSKQTDTAGQPLSFDSYQILLLINNSKDDSFEVASRYQLQNSSVPLHVLRQDFPENEAHIGNARRMLMEEACRRLDRSENSTKVILSTDADSRVAPDWIGQNLSAIEQGAQAVGGVIELDPLEFEKLPERIREIRQLDDRYRLLVAQLEDRSDPQPHDPWPRHYHHFGGSLAVTTSVYRRVGGLPPEPRLEDVAFYDVLLRHDVRFRHSPYVKVRTSARLDGRTSVGLAEQLHQWQHSDHAGTLTLVDSAEYLTLLFDSRREFRHLRSYPGQQAVQSFTRKLRLTPRKVEEALGEEYFGAAWEKLRLNEHLSAVLGAASRQPLVEAVSTLAHYFGGQTWQADRSGTSHDRNRPASSTPEDLENTRAPDRP